MTPLAPGASLRNVQARSPRTDPDATFTPNQLVEHLRALSGGAAPIGAKRLRSEIHAGRLKAARVGSWYRIRWQDFCDWFEKQTVEATPPQNPSDDAQEWAQRKVASQRAEAT